MMSGIYAHFHPDERPFVDRAMEWIERAVGRRSVKLTDFMDPRQAWIVESLIHREPDAAVRFDGGYPQAERRRAVIAPAYVEAEQEDAGVRLLAIAAADRKFVNPDHGDYLGAILGLGIRRDKIGDIHALANECHCLVAAEIADYVRLHLQQVHRTPVSVELLPLARLQRSEALLEELNFTLSSLRLDALLGDVYRLSRAKAQIPIKAGRCKINWKPVEDPSAPVKPGDVISLQGFGRCKVLEAEGQTRKGKIRVKVGKYT